MIWTLYRYILRDVLKLLAMSLGVLVVVLSVGSAIKPISEGLLEPWQIVKVITYMMPVMVTWALPFAAAFASTLVFFRLSTDNEITACAVSGISYRELLAPVLVLGLVLTLGAFVLSNWVVPRFWRLVSAEIEQDIASVVIRTIKKREEVMIKGFVIYADEAQDRVVIPGRTFESGREPYNTLVLRGAAVGRVTSEQTEDEWGREVKTERLRADHTARLAVIDLFRDEGRNLTYLTMKLSDVTSNDPATGMLVEQGRVSIEPLEIPSPLQQSPKFLSLPDLRRRIDDPELSVDVRSRKQELAVTLAAAQMLRRMRGDLIGAKADDASVLTAGDDEKAGVAGGGELTLLSPRGQRYTIQAPSVRLAGGKVRLHAEADRKVVVRSRRGDVTVQRLEAEGAELAIVEGELVDEPRVNLRLETVTVIDPGQPAPTQKRELTLPLLRLEGAVTAPLREMGLAKLLEKAEADPDAKVSRDAKRLRRGVVALRREIESRLHERAAIAVNCLLVLMLGAVMSMLLRHQLPLLIFLWCFLPTVAAFLAIFTGQHMLGDEQMPRIVGVTMAWAGNAALAVMNGVVYMKLSRH